MRLLLELYYAIVIKHGAFFTIWAKSDAMIPLNFTLLFPDVVVVLDSNKNFGGSDLVEKKARTYSYSPSSLSLADHIFFGPWGLPNFL